MKKRLAAAILAIVMLTLMQSVSFAEGGEEEHCCNGVTFDIPLEGKLSHKLDSGNYYLVGDCTATDRVYISGEVNLCLNGHVIATQGATTLQVQEGGVLNIYDCTGEGHIGFVRKGLNNHPLIVDIGGTANLYSGYIFSDAGPTAVDNFGTMNMYSGVIRCNGANSNGIAVKNLGTFNCYGGEIYGITGIMMRNDGCTVHFIDGCTVIDATERAFWYASEIRPVFIDSGDARWRTEQGGEYSNAELTSLNSLNKTTYFEVRIGEDEIPIEKEDDIAENSSDASEKTEDVAPDETVPVEEEPVTEETALPESHPEEAEAGIEESADYSEYDDRTEDLRAEYSISSQRGAGMLLVFAVIAFLSAAAVVLLSIKIKKPKEKTNSHSETQDS